MLSAPEKPYSREEEYLANIAGEGTPVPEKAYSRKEAYLDAISGHVSGMASDISDLNQKVAALATDFSYKGSVATYADLPANPAIGDVYTTEDEGYMYVWDGNSWQILNMQGGGGGGPTVVQTTGTSTEDVMSQNATTDMVYTSSGTGIKIGYCKAGTNHAIAIGYSDSTNAGNNSISIGEGATSRPYNISIGSGAQSPNNNAFGISLGRSAGTSIPSGISGYINLGAYSNATATGEMNIGTTDSTIGYNSTNYRLISGVHDGQNLHDAATLAQGNTLSDTAPTTSTIGVLGQLYTDVANMHTYQCTGVSGNTYTWTQRW